MSNKAVAEDKLVAAINEAVKSLGSQSLTFFVAATYIVFSAAEVRDEFFISHDKLTLPIANVSIPTNWFFLVAPTLLTGLYIMILLHEYYLLEKLAALPWKRREVRTELFFPSISISGHFPGEYPRLVGGLGFFSFWFAYLVVPLSVLVYLQMCSLRFRMPMVERGIGICVAITLLASISFVIATSLVKRGNPALWGRPAARIFVLVGASAALVFLGWFVASYARMLGHPRSCDAKSKFLEIFPFRRHLVLTSIPEKLLESSDGGDRVFNFRRRDLRCATFSGVRLAGADFRGADLTGATFDSTNLVGADFSAFRRNKTSLRDALFIRSDLTQAKFRGALLIEATFRGTNLQEANFLGADLSKASMLDANLVAADFVSSRLRGADLRKAQLSFARLDYASIEVARFDDAWMDRASFKGAAAFGASFRGARLRGAYGLPLAGVDLQSAWVWGLNSCGALASFPTHVNFRDLIFDPVTDWQPLLEKIRDKAKTPFLDLTRERMKAPLVMPAGTEGPVCFSGAETIMVAPKQGWPAYLRERNVLYDKPHPGTPLEEWPTLPPVTENDYLAGLVRELIKKACAEEAEAPGRGTTLRDVLELRAREDDRFGRRLQQQLQSVSCASLAVPPTAGSRSG